MNAILHAKVASGAFPDVEVWDYDRYAESADSWFVSDGIHETATGAWGTADWISRHVAAGRREGLPRAVEASPSPPASPCPDPDPLPATIGLPDIRALYGV